MIALWLGCAAPADPPAAETADTATEDPVARGRLAFAFPIAEPDRMVELLYTGVDHDGATGTGPSAACLSYDGLGFPFCYDGHDGTDFLLDGGFEAMDAGSATVVAAADGVVEAAEDGHYDRCHTDAALGQVVCDGYEMIANSVVIAHATGDRTLYWHLKQGSVAVAPGDEVRAGDVLGLVGSSGNSSTPHLHFELQDADGVVLDPFAGAYSQPETWWCDQGERGALPGPCAYR